MKKILEQIMTKNSERWYDSDPTVSLAISFIRNAGNETQIKVAELIVEKCHSLGIQIKEAKVKFYRRWYDKNQKLCSAMEHFEKCSEPVRKEIAVEIINYLTELK